MKPGEAQFLCAVLNSARVTMLARPLMSYGKDERHVDKHIWRLPIPEFQPANKLHLALVHLAETAEAEIRQLELEEGLGFVALRRRIRRFLQASRVGQEIEELVAELMG
jgi:hypothetical protein